MEDSLANQRILICCAVLCTADERKCCRPASQHETPHVQGGNINASILMRLSTFSHLQQFAQLDLGVSVQIFLTAPPLGEALVLRMVAHRPVHLPLQVRHMGNLVAHHSH